MASATATKKSKPARKNTAKPTRKASAKTTVKATPKAAPKGSARKPAGKASLATSAKHDAPSMALSALRDRAIAHLKYTHEQMLKFVDGFSAAQTVAQPAGIPNHVIWQLGHLTVTYHWFASMMDGNQHGTPEGYGRLFGHGSVPTTNARDYPSFEDARAAYNAALDRLVTSADGKPQKILTDVSKPSEGWCPDCLDALHKAAWHNGWHLGQTSVLRKVLGLPSVYGA